MSSLLRHYSGQAYYLLHKQHMLDGKIGLLSRCLLAADMEHVCFIGWACYVSA